MEKENLSSTKGLSYKKRNTGDANLSFARGLSYEKMDAKNWLLYPTLSDATINESVHNLTIDMAGVDKERIRPSIKEMLTKI